MAVLRDGRGRWRYRKTINLPGGRKERISGTPIFNTKIAAEDAEREHIQRLLSSPSTQPPAPPKEVPTLREVRRGVHRHVRHGEQQAVRGADEAVDL